MTKTMRSWRGLHSAAGPRSSLTLTGTSLARPGTWSRTVTTWRTPPSLPTAPGPRRVCVGCAPVTGVVCGSDLGEQGEYSVGGSKFAPVTGVVCGSDLGEQGEY